MRELFEKTAIVKAASGADLFSQPVLALFRDAVYLRALLKEIAKRFFGAAESSREAKLIETETYADCLFFPPEGKKLTVEMCAQIIEESELRPVERTEKLFVLDAFDAASAVVQNKLLKVLEEPPEGVHFLLGASSAYPILPTVLSRVKKFELPPFSEEAIAGALRRNHAGAEGIEAAAAASGGIYSTAESFLDGGSETFSLAFEFLRGEEIEAFCRRNGERKDKKEFLAAVKAILRDVLLISTGEARYVQLKSAEVNALAREYPPGAAVAAIELTSNAERELGFNAGFANCLYALALGIKEEKTRWKKLS